MDKIAGSDGAPKQTGGIEFDWKTVEPKPLEPKPVKPNETAPVDKAAAFITVKPPISGLQPSKTDAGSATPLATRIAPGLDSKIASPGVSKSLIDKLIQPSSPGQYQFQWQRPVYAEPVTPADLPTPAPTEYKGGGGAGNPANRTRQAADVSGEPAKAPADWRIPQSTDVKAAPAKAPADWRIPQPTDVKTAPTQAPADWRIPPATDVKSGGGAGAPSDKVTVSENPNRAVPPGTLVLSYTDPNFDKKLWSGNHNALWITDLPPEVKVSSWVDNDGFFLFYKNGTDNRKPHHLPPSIKTLEANTGVVNVDELRLQARVAARLDKQPVVVNFEKVYGRENPLQFAQRMGSLGAQALADQEAFLRKEVAQSPNDPMVHFFLSDVLLGQAFKPIIEQVTAGSNVIRLKTPYTDGRLDEAIKERQKGMDIMKRDGLNFPNPPIILGPRDRQGDIEAALGLYPNWWGEIQLKALKFYIDRMPEIELPPILPPR